VKSAFVVGTSNFGSPCHWVEQHLSVIVPLYAFKEISCCKFTFVSCFSGSRWNQTMEWSHWSSCTIEWQAPRSSWHWSKTCIRPAHCILQMSWYMVQDRLWHCWFWQVPMGVVLLKQTLTHHSTSCLPGHLHCYLRYGPWQREFCLLCIKYKYTVLQQWLEIKVSAVG
jgi:hypothetical protein